MATHDSIRNIVVAMDGQKPTFNVVILYEDQPAAVRALQAYEVMKNSLEEEFIFDCQLWRFDVLELEELVEDIQTSVTGAQSILISTQSSCPSSEDIPSAAIALIAKAPPGIQKAWIHPGRRDGTLFEPLLLDSLLPPTGSPTSEPNSSGRTAKTTPTGSSRTIESIQHRACSVSTLLTRILDNPGRKRICTPSEQSSRR